MTTTTQHTQDPLMCWKVNTPQLLKELMSNHGMGIMRIPMATFANLLGQVAQRASQLNDDKLNALMAKLALYEITDPYSPEFDQKRTEELIKKGAD